MNSNTETFLDIELIGALKPSFEQILTPEAIDFITKLHHTFNWRREELLKRRVERQFKLDEGEMPTFLTTTEQIRNGNWTVNPIPNDLQNRKVEITGPVDRKMIINALNSGAKVFMADFEDANSPTWDNCIEGQINLRDAIQQEIDFVAENGKEYRLNEKVAVLKVRPRGWHLTEKHLEINGEPISASIFDFGLYFFHNAKALIEKGSGPYFYLPKLENHLEARLWDEIFVAAQTELGIPIGTIKATVLIESILAAFEMDEIIYELRRHLAGLNAGRWDYIFSVIKKFKNNADFILPDRADVTMKVPFMRAYTQLLVKTCHKRAVHAIGGMAAFIPNRRDKKVNTMVFERVISDKELEISNGFDGTWVAHPDLVPIVMAAFEKHLGEKPHQKEVLREDVVITAHDLLDVRIDNASITENGLRTNINVGILYIESWLRGIGAAAIHNLMEDAATAEISRAQIWQWLKHRVKTQEGEIIEPNYYHRILVDEVEKIKYLVELNQIPEGKYKKAAEIFNTLVMKQKFNEFLTLGAYKELA